MTTTTQERSTAHRLILRLAARRLAMLTRQRAEYDEECERWHKQGYRPHYCIHGTNLWVDYDCACGWCEMGVTDQELALGWARENVAAFEARLKAVRDLCGTGLPREMAEPLWGWACESVDLLRWSREGYIVNPLDSARLP